LARKTNFSFERREREKNKAAGKAEKVRAKAEKKLSEEGTADLSDTSEA
jgi:hypothetical protein